MMRVNNIIIQLVFGTILFLQVHSQALHDQLLRDNSGTQLRKLLQEGANVSSQLSWSPYPEPGELDLNNIDYSNFDVSDVDRSDFNLSNVLSANDMLLQLDPNNPPEGVLDLSNVDLSNVPLGGGISVKLDPNNPMVKDLQDKRFYLLSLEQQQELLQQTFGQKYVPRVLSPEIVSLFNLTSNTVLVPLSRPDIRSLFNLSSNAVGVPKKIVPPEDERLKVNDTLLLPYKSIGQIGSQCTGTVIGPRHVLTAAHCIERLPIQFTPARNGSNDPFGTYEAESLYIPDEYFDISKYQYDYGVITLKQSFGSDVVPLKIATPCDSTREYNLNIIGYPADKKEQGFFYQYTTGCGFVLMDCAWRTFRHSCDTFSGMSGSAMMTFREGNQGTEYLIRGVHSAGWDRGLIYNQGVIITNEIQQKINQIIQTNS